MTPLDINYTQTQYITIIYSKDPADRIKTIIHFKKKYYMSRFAGRNFNR
jgi:hypothetical protein